MEIPEQLYDTLEKVCDECRSDTIALSGGLDSTILAYMMQGRRPMNGIAVIAKDFVATDLTYCQLAASRLGVNLHIAKPDAIEILLGVSETIRILGNFNDLEIRNAVVMYLAFKAAKRAGIDSVITGDGADELFAGYDFLSRARPPQLSKELERLRRIMHFPSHQIGKELGVNVESPFLHPTVIKNATSMPTNMLVGQHDGRKTGKLVLRRLFSNKIPNQIAWRSKSAMQDGAGTAGLVSLLDSLVTNETFRDRARAILTTEGVHIRTKESLFYYEEYRNYFAPPMPAAEDEQSCPHCKYRMMPDSTFCRMCGLYPAVASPNRPKARAA